MRTVTVKITGVAPLQFGRYHASEKLDKETADDAEQRTWKEKAHYDEKTRQLFLPPMALKNAISATAKVLALPIPGRGKSLYTKHFLSGIICVDPAMLTDESGKPILLDHCKKVAVFGNSKGLRGGDGPRVQKFFPTISPPWKTDLVYQITDDTITEPVFEKVVRESGLFNGFGVFRPQSGGFYGRFVVNSIKWEEK